VRASELDGILNAHAFLTTMVSADLTAALTSASASYAYTRVLAGGEGSITVFFGRASPDS
jgi:hypothetical protein